jgi:hypothetical protein
MAWEHAMLGDVAAADLRSGQGDRHERALLEKLGTDPHNAAEEGLETLRLPGSGLVVTLGELNVLPDYLGHPEQIETAPVQFMEPLIQSVRCWSIAELRRSAGEPRSRRRLPGALRYAQLGGGGCGGLAEGAEVATINRLGKRCGLAPSRRYPSVLARNVGHFAPFSWYRWHCFHLKSRELIQQSAVGSAADRECLRRRARIYAGYADHFLQDSFAAGHLINKALVMQWYIEWMAENRISYPHGDVLAALTAARQPLLHGPGHYDRDYARRGDQTSERAGAVPRPPWDAEDLIGTGDRVAVSGVIGDNDDDGRAAYAAYLTMLCSGTLQIAPRVVHDYFNKRSLVVSSAPDGPRFRVFGDRGLLTSADGAWSAAQAAGASRRAISELLRTGETAVDSWEIFDSFPGYVEQDGRLVSLEEWHRTGLRDLCFGELFGRWSTRATRRVISTAFSQLGTVMDSE